MTPDPDPARAALLNARPAPLPFDPRDLVAIRVRPAEFARMCSVTRQTVSQWARKGWITPGPDGLIDPVTATRHLLQRADPARLRARLFREATETLGELRERIRDLESTLAEEREQQRVNVARARVATRGEAVENLTRFRGALIERFEEGQAARKAGRLADWLDDLEAAHFWGWDLAEYRELKSADD